MTFLRNGTKSGKSSTLRTTAEPSPVTPAAPTPSVDVIVAAVLAALSAKPSSTTLVTKDPTAKPSITSKPTAKPSKVKASGTKSHPTVPKFADCCAVSMGADKSTLVDFDNCVLVAEALRANHADREWTAIGGLKTAVRQLLRANGTLNPTTLETAWKAVRTEARKQGFSA